MILIQTAFPRVLKMGKIIIRSERLYDLSVVGKLFAIIKRDRVKVLFVWLKHFDNSDRNNLGMLGWNLRKECLFTDTVDQGHQNPFMAFANHCVGLPVA